MAQIDIDYNNVDFIPGGADAPDRWSADARSFRETEAAIGRARLNVAYGAGERQKLDLFYPAGKPKGLVDFVHGGYWLRFDRAFWSHFSAGFTEAGWVVALPSYTLAPKARISGMTREIAAALDCAADMVAGPIRLCGHSAGGHLVARIGCKDVMCHAKPRVQNIVPISPVSDLRPLLETAMNATLQLDPDEATTESPVLHPAPDIPTTVWVGAEERPVFLDQARWLAEAWETPLRIDPGRHHFDVIDGLRTAGSPLIQTILN